MIIIIIIIKSFNIIVEEVMTTVTPHMNTMLNANIS
jgi:hypothetical protein